MDMRPDDTRGEANERSSGIDDRLREVPEERATDIATSLSRLAVAGFTLSRLDVLEKPPLEEILIEPAAGGTPCACNSVCACVPVESCICNEICTCDTVASCAQFTNTCYGGGGGGGGYGGYYAPCW